MMQDIPDILQRILRVKQQEVEQRTAHRPLHKLRERANGQTPPRGFLDALRRKQQQGDFAVIAEIKKASPSKGVMRTDYQPDAIARSYAAAGAACLSVLTDQDFFQGHEQHLSTARGACKLPVIRKDFIIDTYQVAEARSIGADCILLIAAALTDDQLRTLFDEARAWGMDVLVEVHNETELSRALKLDLDIIGINNRNLRTFEVDLNTTYELLDKIPSEVTVVTESGILQPSDVLAMRKRDVHAFLVGEAFMRAADPGEALQSLFALD